MTEKKTMVQDNIKEAPGVDFLGALIIGKKENAIL
jgi:hypothetical protein